MSNYEQDREILLHAPNGTIFWDGEDYLDERFCKKVTVVRYESCSYFPEEYTTSKHITWEHKYPINTGSLRRLSDMKKIVELQEKVAIAQVYCNKIIEDLNFVEDD